MDTVALGAAVLVEQARTRPSHGRTTATVTVTVYRRLSITVLSLYNNLQHLIKALVTTPSVRAGGEVPRWYRGTMHHAGIVQAGS